MFLYDTYDIIVSRQKVNMQSLYCTKKFFKVYRYYKLNNEIIKGMNSIANQVI